LANGEWSEIDKVGYIQKFAKKRSQKTQTLHMVNLSYTHLRAYLSFLASKILLTMEAKNGGAKKNKIYTTTGRWLKLPGWRSDERKEKSYKSMVGNRCGIYY